MDTTERDRRRDRALHEEAWREVLKPDYYAVFLENVTSLTTRVLILHKDYVPQGEKDLKKPINQEIQADIASLAARDDLTPDDVPVSLLVKEALAMMQASRPNERIQGIRLMMELKGIGKANRAATDAETKQIDDLIEKFTRNGELG